MLISYPFHIMYVTLVRTARFICEYYLYFVSLLSFKMLIFLLILLWCAFLISFFNFIIYRMSVSVNFPFCLYNNFTNLIIYYSRFWVYIIVYFFMSWIIKELLGQREKISLSFTVPYLKLEGLGQDQNLTIYLVIVY